MDSDTTKENCKKCGRIRRGYDPRTGEVLPDPCLGKLPGVISACCGHGQFAGHIIFENGTRIEFLACSYVQVVKNYISEDVAKLYK